MKKLILSVLVLAGCGQPPSTSSLNGLGYDGGGNNRAVLIGAPNGLAGVPTDIRELNTLFSKPEYHFNVAIDANASTSEIFDLVKQEAREADSFLFYFSGHGNRGILLADDRSFTFREVIAAIAEVRTEPFDRLIVMLDSCLSGSFVDGNGDAIVTEPDSETGSHPLIAETIEEPLQEQANTLYKQAFIFSASKQNENSQDLGSARGGSFTYTFRQTVEKFTTEKPLATFRDLATEVSQLTDDEYGHTPMWRGYPAAEVMDDYFFMYRVDQ